MGMLSRFINVIRSNINAMLNKAEDPTKMLEQTLLDMEGAARKAKEQVARALADQKRLEKSLHDERALVEKYQKGAVAAVEKGDDNLAREALTRKNEHARIAAQYEGELEQHRGNVEKLKDSLRELDDKIAEIRRKKNLLISKQKRAEAQDQIYSTLQGLDSSGALGTIERMENKIEEMSALADARQDLHEEMSGEDLDARLAKLGGGGDVDQELLALKEQAKLENK